MRNMLGYVPLLRNLEGVEGDNQVPTVTIDGKKVRVKKNATVLDAAKRAGIWIPTLCYHPSVSSEASCRLCMVELDRGEWRQLVTACNYPVRRDIVVYAYSEAAVRARRGVMELLLARAPESEELKALAAKMGIERTSYPTVTESQRSCILCGLCVSVCEQMIGQAAIGFAGRGVQRTVAAPFRLPAEDCIGCGACAAVCPVGTIKIRMHPDSNEIEISPFKSRFKLRLCEQCNSPIVSEKVAANALGKLDANNEELREILRLCPSCRSLRTAGQLAAMPGYDQE